MSDTGRYNLATFAEKVKERAAQVWPNNGGIQADGHSIIVLVPDGKGDQNQITIHLGRGYRVYWQSGDLEGTLGKFFEPFLEPPPTREAIGEQCMLKFDHAKLLENQPRLHWPVAANPNVVITGVLDRPGSMRFFGEDELQEYGVTREEFWDWGMAHLRTLAQQFKPAHLAFGRETGWNGHELWVVNNGSGYASAALLCPDIVDSWLPGNLRGKWVAGIPDRDTLIIARPTAPAELIASAMVKGRAEGLYPFDWTIYTYQGGNLVNFWSSLDDDELRKRARDAGRTPPR